MSGRTGELLPGSQEVPFSQIEATVARLVRDLRRRRRAPARALTATVIVIGTHDQLAPAADALEQLGDAGGVRAILISEGEQTAPTARVTEYSIAVEALSSKFLDNAVAALRLSSLPALIWWRSGSVDALESVAHLADRIVLDTADPTDVWRRAPALCAQSAVTDLRWTRLTRWRSLLANLFEVPQVHGAGPITSLTIESADVHAARLFAGWLRSTLQWTPDARVEIRNAPASGSPLQRVQLANDTLRIEMTMRQPSSCVEACLEGDVSSTRVVPVGDVTLSSLIAEELSVRTRDVAFEKALAKAQEIEG